MNFTTEAKFIKAFSEASRNVMMAIIMNVKIKYEVSAPLLMRHVL